MEPSFTYTVDQGDGAWSSQTFQQTTTLEVTGTGNVDTEYTCTATASGTTVNAKPTMKFYSKLCLVSIRLSMIAFLLDRLNA